MASGGEVDGLYPVLAFLEVSGDKAQDGFCSPSSSACHAPRPPVGNRGAWSAGVGGVEFYRVVAKRGAQG